MSKIIDETGNRELIERLQALGLSDKEALVYIALLPRQDTGSSKLIQATGLHGQFVYAALGKLEELGLAKHVIQNGRKKFSANPPTRLLSLIEEKRLSAQAVAKELQSRFAGQHEQNIEIFQGDTAFVAHQIDLLRRVPEGSSIDVIASESEKYMATVTALGLDSEYERIRIERKIGIRYIGSESQRARMEKRKKDIELFEFRVLPGQATGVMNTDTWYDNVTLNMFGNPIVCLTITNKEMADGYRAFFETIWALAQK